MKHFPFALALGVLSLLAGCSSLPKTIEKPEVALQSLDIQKASLTNATVLLKLAVHNPNSFKIDIDSMKYGLNINGKPLATGNQNQGTSLAANSDSEVVVPIRMSYWDLFNQFSDFMKGKKSSYQITGAITSGRRVFPFEHTGKLELPYS